MRSTSKKSEERPEPSKSAPLANLERILSTHFYKPDIQAIRIVLGTMQAHRLDVGDPAWLFVVAPPGSGKTTMSIMGASCLPDVLMLGDFSENTFLSGFFGHDKPGMLEKLGRTSREGNTFIAEGNAILLAKDFTTVLSMRREKRAAILGHLREIHDGMFKRDFGTGVTKIWKGRITMIAAVTPALDRHTSVFSTLGERFLQVRWHRPDSQEAGVWAIHQQGSETKWQDELKQVFGEIFKRATTSSPSLDKEMTHRIACIAEIVAISRTHIYRNGFGNREIEYVPEPEANTRVSKGLAAIAKGIASINGRAEVAEDDLQDCFRVALDSIPELRRQIIVAVAAGTKPDPKESAKTTRLRAEEELEELGILEKSASGLALSRKTESLWRTAKVR